MLAFGVACAPPTDTEPGRATSPLLSTTGVRWPADQLLHQRFTFTPDPGYVVDTLSIDGTTMPAASSYTFTNITANHAIAISFTNGDSSDASARDGERDAAGSDARDDAHGADPSTGAAGANADAARSGAAGANAGGSGAGGVGAPPTTPGVNGATPAGCGCAMANEPPLSPLACSLLGGALVFARRGRRRAASRRAVQAPVTGPS